MVGELEYQSETNNCSTERGGHCGNNTRLYAGFTAPHNIKRLNYSPKTEYIIAKGFLAEVVAELIIFVVYVRHVMGNTKRLNNICTTVHLVPLMAGF